MGGLFDNPFIFIVLIIFIVVRFFNALQEKSKNNRPPQDFPPTDAETFENKDYRNGAGPELKREAAIEKDEGKKKRIIEEEDYIPFPQGIRGFAAQQSASEVASLSHSILIDIEKDLAAPDMRRQRNTRLNSAPAKPYMELAAGHKGSFEASSLKQAVIWAEILGPPRGLKDF